MPQVVAFVVAYWVQIMAVAAVVASGYAAIQARNMKMGGDSQFAQQQMVRSSNEPRRGIYGRAMVSGPLMFIGETGTDREWLYLVIAVCGHVTDGCELVKLDDEVVWKENGGLVSRYRNHVKIKYFNGTQTTADSELVSKFNSWTNNHIGNGISYLRIGIKSDQDVFPSGIPNIKMLIRGKRVFDPRDVTQSRDNPVSWKYTDNWALCCLDYAMLESGVGATEEEIDLDSFIAAANLSDEFVEYQATKFEKRYTINGTWMADQTPQTIIESLLSAGSGKLVFTHGVYSLFAGAYYGPATLTLDDDGLRDDMSLTPFTERADLCNAVRGTFVDPNNFWQSVDFPPVENAFYREKDKGEYIDHDIDLEMVISPWTAQRLAKLHLEQSRAGFTVNYPAKLGVGLQCWPGRVIRLHIPRLGINKEFEVVDWSLKPDQGVDLVLKETAPEIFDWALGEATSRDITPNSDLPDPKQVPTPSGLAFAAAADNSSFLGSCSWNAPGGNSAYRYRLAVFDGLQALIYQQDIASTQCHLPKIDVGFYTVKVWAINTFGYLSNVAAEITIGSSSPANVIGIGVEAGPLSLTIKPGTAASIAQTTVFEVIGGQNNVIEDAVTVGTGKEIVWADRHPNTTYYLWARTSNNQGKSAWFGPVQTKTSNDKSAIVDLIGATFDKYTWFAWADDNQGSGFTTVEVIGDGKAYMGIATDKDSASPSGNWQEYTWTKIKTEIPPVFTPEEETKLDNLMAGKLPFAPDKDMLAAQDALSNPALANNLITALSLLNQGINAPALGGETPTGAQSKATAAQNAAASDATTKANNAKAAAETYALAKANLAEVTAKAYADGIVSDEEERAIADATAKANAAQSAAITAAAADATSKANNAKAQAEANAALDALNKANTAKSGAISAAATDATTKANNAKAAAETYALAKANLAEVTAKAYADGIVSDEEDRAIADAQAKADAAKTAAIAAAAADATSKANNAKAQAEANAALDALNKANTAKTDAISTASTDATTKANNAKTQAISSAATDATTKANSAQSAAIAAAAADATTKANNAKAQAEASAALDALNKANTAKTDAINESLAQSGGHNLLNISTFTSNKNKGGWSTGSVELVSSVPNITPLDGREYALKLITRDSYEVNNIVPVKGGETLYFSAWINTQACNYSVGFGYRKVVNGVSQSSWFGAITLGVGNSWTWLQGSIVIPSDCTSIIPWVVINGNSGFGICFIQDLVVSRSPIKSGALAIKDSLTAAEVGADSVGSAALAQSAAIAAAAADATSKANNAKAQAEANAALDALNKANTAKTDAISTASTDATTKANNAKAQAISSAATDATTKANSAQSAAIAAAAIDATAKANNAKSQAEANAALDALNKANAAKADAIKISDPIGLTAKGVNIEALGSTGGHNNGTTAWDGSIYSAISYTGGAIATATIDKLSGTTKRLMFGLTITPSTVSYLDINFAIYADLASYLVYENGGSKGVLLNRAPIAGDVLSVKYDGVKVYYSINGAVLKETIANRDLNLFLKAVFYGSEFYLKNITISALSNLVIASDDATAKANSAQAAAIATAAADATTKANNAKAQAEANAALDAINKANAAKTDAISTAATDATAKANSALTAANSELNNRINAAEAAALDNLFSISGLPYRKDIVIGGDSDKYYPVVFFGGSQDVNRRIKIWRGYNEQAPNDWYSSTHKGQLTIDWLGNFGGWGGAGYFDQLLSHRWEYTELLGDLFRFGSSQAYCFMLRGGGAVYHFASDLNVLPEVYYNQELLHAASNSYAPAPSTAVNSERILYAKLGNASFGNLLAYSGQFTALKSRLGNFGGLTADTIAALAIATNHLQAGAVTADKVTADIALIQKLIANVGLFNQLKAQLGSFGGLTAETIATLAIATNHLQAGAVTVDKVSANAITAEKIAALAIATNHLQAGAITADKVGANAITAAKIAALAIATNHLQAGAITVDKVGANAITADKIAALAIATNHLQAGAVTADKVTADTALIQKLIANVGLFNQLQAQLAVFGGLAANSIAANAITVDKLDVRARSLVNNVSQTGVNTGWSGGVVVDHTHKGKLTKALEFSSSGNGTISSDWFNVDQTKIYEVNATIHRVSGGSVGDRYFGINANGDGNVGVIHPVTRVISSSSNNFYFWAGDIADGQYMQMRGYIIGSDVDPASIPESLNVSNCCQLNPSITQVRLRVLNYYNAGVTTVDRWLNMSVTELGGGQISANQLLANSGLFNQLKAKLASFGGLTANEIQADTALINKLVGTSGLFNDLVARLAVFGGLTANSIASDAILGRHIKAGEKITSPIIEGGEVRLIGTAFMKVQSATPFGPDGLVEWYGPKILVNGAPDWANIRKSNAITYLAANGDAYFGGSLSAGVLKTGVTNTDKTPYAANSYPVTIGPFGSNGKAKTVVVSFALSAHSQNPTNPNNPTQPQLSWQLQRKIGSGSWATVSSGVFNGTTSADFEAEPPAHWFVRETCWGSFTFTDNTNSTSDFNYRVLVISYSRYHATSNVNTHNLSLISTEQ